MQGGDEVSKELEKVLLQVRCNAHTINPWTHGLGENHGRAITVCLFIRGGNHWDA